MPPPPSPRRAALLELRVAPRRWVAPDVDERLDAHLEEALEQLVDGSSGRGRWCVDRRPWVHRIALAMAETVTWDGLRELAEFRAESGCAISLYLNLDPSLSPTAGDATRISSS